jgi:hypothetical protein
MHPMLLLIIATYVAFGGTLGFVSVWSNRASTRPRQRAATAAPTVDPAQRQAEASS